ncbi:MAG TPA: glycosyltransferase [Anaerolineales bacterium]|nr:glycosyltransferase [Anaerolineales bacterium]
MQIALVCQSYPPMVSGIAVAVRHLAEGLAGRGHDVLVLSASDRGDAYTETRNGVRLVRLSSMPTPARRRQRWSWWSRDEVERHLDTFQPDVLHLHDPFLGAMVMPGYAHERGIPLIATAHALPMYPASQVPDLPGLRSLVESALWAFGSDLISQCQAVIAPSRYTARQVDEHGGPGAVVISNGVDLNRFRPGPTSPDERQRLAGRYRIDPERPIILHVGRVDREKNVDDVVRAAHLAMASVDAQLVVIGDGSRREDVEDLAEDLGIGDRSRFIGFVEPNGDLPDLYRAGALFVIASDLESEGIVVLEAAACGLPIVAVRATSMPELVETPGCGYLVSPGDVRRMAERIVDILKDPARREALSLAALGMAQQHSLEKTLEQHEALYASLLSAAR